MKARAPIILGGFVALLAAWPLAYLSLRATHLLVHTSYWVSQEGLYGHHWHDIGADRPRLRRAFAPLVEVELEAQRLRQP